MASQTENGLVEREQNDFKLNVTKLRVKYRAHEPNIQTRLEPSGGRTSKSFFGSYTCKNPDGKVHRRLLKRCMGRLQWT